MCHAANVFVVKCIVSPLPSLFLGLWEPTTTLVNQRRPQQHQRPLGQAPLATANKDVDLRCASQSGSWSCPYLERAHLEHTQQQCLLATTPSANSTSCRLDSLGSPLPAFTVLWPAASARKTGVPSTSQPTAANALPAFIRRTWP
jgi:hypothetical protein